MITRNVFYSAYPVEQQKREEEINLAAQDRMIQSAKGECESLFTTLSIRVLDTLGSQLVQWGNQLQCRCAEIAMMNSKRAI
jgi:hypothetical protein